MEPYSLLNNVVFLYIETTGPDAEKDKIMEINAVKIKDHKVTKFNALINQDKSATINIDDINNVTSKEALKGAGQFKEVMGDFLIFIETLHLICHNASFEEKFLRVDNEFLDSIELIAILFPEVQEFELQHLTKKFLPKHKQEIHKEKIIEILNYIISMFFYENGYTLPMSLTELENWSWYKFLSKINMDDVKFFIDNVPTAFEEKVKEPYTVFALKDYEKLFENKDIWRRNGTSYSLRPQQLEASRFIREGLEKGKLTIMEAPTGIGKSMAYLLPTAIYSHLKQEKVIISTNTKSLQNQLVEKDIPNILEALNLKGDISYVLIKGKSNYLCFDRFEDIEYPKDMKTLIGYVYLKRLITEKGIGDIEEINYLIRKKFSLDYLLEQCYCDSELCDVDSCRYRETCYYATRVEALKEAQLVVVNHSLLLKWPYQSITPLENIVVDEAHNLTHEVYDAFESTLISYEFEKFLMDIYDAKEKSGYLYYLSKRAKKETLPLNEIESNIGQINYQMNNIKNVFEHYVLSSGISKEYNIKEHLNKDNPKIMVIIKCLDNLKNDISSLNINLDKAVSILKEISTMEKDKRLKILVEKIDILNSYIMLLDTIVIQSEEGYCFYFEVDKNFRWWKISSIPLDVSGYFYEKVLSNIKSCLFVSATLSTDDSYDNLKNTLGINIAKSQNKEIVEVPPIKPIFDYKGKSVIYAMEDMDPNDIEAFSEEMKKFVLELLNNIEGNIIMLFTSRKRLTAFKEISEEALNVLGIKIVEEKRDIEKLKSREARYILLGSKGYFEGMDIPGDTVTAVILDKVPNINSLEPFYKSLIDRHKEKGADYWQGYSRVNLPIVSIDLKQIYGRIIRTEYDYGSLFIMSKFDSGNSTVRKLEKQLHEVPIIRKSEREVFKDLKARTIRWKQINLYKIMKEVKSSLKKSIQRKKLLSEIKAPKDIESFINEFMNMEYTRRKLKYDVNIILEENNEVKIYIDDKEINLGKNKTNINEYFKECQSYDK